MVLTFSGNTQTFREIEIFGVATSTTVDSVTIVGNSTVFVRDITTLTATVHGINEPNQTVKWSSSNEAVATVDSTGLVTGIGAGTAEIIATSASDSTLSDTLEITVPAPTVTGVSIDGNYSIWVGHTDPFSATVTGTNASQTVKWTSSDEAVATVDSITGVVRGVAEGTVTITATSAVDNTQTASKTIAIIPVQTNNIAPSAEIELTATSFYSASKDTNIANITDGVKNTNNGKELIHGTLGGTTLTFEWPSIYHYGRFVFYNIISGASNRIIGSTVEFFNGDASVYLDTISSSAAITTILPDSTIQFNKVVVTFDGYIQNFREIEVYGTIVPPTVTSVSIAGSDTVLVEDTISLSTAVSVINGADTTVTWSSSNPNLATVDSLGVVRGIFAGTVTITATSVADNSKTATKTIVIHSAPMNIAPSAERTTTVNTVWNTSAGEASTDSNIIQQQFDVIVNGNKGDDTELFYIEGPDSATITFTWPGKLYTNGKFILYHRQRPSCCNTRINGSVVQFFNGDTEVATGNFSGFDGSKYIDSIEPSDTILFNKVVLTFSGDKQNIREIEIFGVATPTTVDSVRIAGDYSIWVGHTARFSATVFGTVVQTVKWSSSNTAVATVDPNTGVVTAVAEGTVTIEATSTVDNTQKDSRTIAIIPVQTNFAPSAEITTTVTSVLE